MTRRFTWVGLGVGVTALLLLSCSRERALQAVAPPETDRFARALFDTLRTGGSDATLRMLSPEASAQPGVADSIRSIERQFASIGAIDSVHLAGGVSFYPAGTDVVRRQLSYEVFGARRDAMVGVEVLEEMRWRGLNGLHIDVLEKSVAVNNGFVRNLGIPQVAILVLAFVLVGFHLITAIMVARTPMRRRWLWAAIALFGVARISINWTTLAMLPQVMAFQLLSVGGARMGAFGPWIVSITLPLGAIVALERRHKFLTATRGTPAYEADRVPGGEGPDA